MEDELANEPGPLANWLKAWKDEEEKIKKQERLDDLTKHDVMNIPELKHLAIHTEKVEQLREEREYVAWLVACYR